MNSSLLTGKLVRLGAVDPEEFARANSRWERDSEFHRLSDTIPAQAFSIPRFRRFIESQLDRDPPAVLFHIYTLADHRLIGVVGLGGISWSHGDCWVGIVLGERADWGRGYGTDAMAILLRFAFTELNLHRVGLSVFSYNPRAIRSYEKLGFQYEGCARQAIRRDGQYWNEIFMGIRRDAWMQANPVP